MKEKNKKTSITCQIDQPSTGTIFAAMGHAQKLHLDLLAAMAIFSGARPLNLFEEASFIEFL